MKRVTWTVEMDEVIIREFPNKRTADVAKQMGLTYSQVSNRAYVLDVKKTDEYLKKHCNRLDGVVGSSTRFQKGHLPVNKGKKISEVMSPEKVQKVLQTAFKKGNLPLNTKPNEWISERRDNRGILYKHIRISQSKWIHLHVHLWQQAYGQIPKGYCVVFKDGNTMNCYLDNLELISRKELMVRNSIMRYPAELRQTMKTLSKLNRTINQLEKDGTKQTQ